MRALMASAVLLAACSSDPAAPATTALPYTDDFANPQSGWQTLNDPNAEVKYDNGKLRVLVKQQTITQWSLAGKAFTDGVLEVDAVPNGGPKDNGFGVLFRVKDRKNFYHFAISSDGNWQAGLSKEGKWEAWADWQPHPAIKLDTEANRIKIVMKGDALSFYVNDQLVGQHTDNTLPSGDIGVFAMTFIDNPGTDISFDNVSVTEVKDVKP
jgi:Domain of Unknown Function (DUF1080)